MPFKMSMAVLALGFIAACDVIPVSEGNQPPTPPTPVLALYGGDVIAAVPDGYCIETKASRPASGFAAMVACQTIAGEAGRPALNGFVSTQVGPSGSALVNAAKPAFAAFLSTTAGEAILSTAGDAGTVTVVAVDQTDTGVVARFTDTAPARVPGLQQTEWRSFVDMKGRLVTIAVRGLAGDPLTADQGRTLLDRAVAAFVAANVPQSADVAIES